MRSRSWSESCQNLEPWRPVYRDGEKFGLETPDYDMTLIPVGSSLILSTGTRILALHRNIVTYLVCQSLQSYWLTDKGTTEDASNRLWIYFLLVWFQLILTLELEHQRSQQNGLNAVEETMIPDWGFQSIIQYFSELWTDQRFGTSWTPLLLCHITDIWKIIFIIQEKVGHNIDKNLDPINNS